VGDKVRGRVISVGAEHLLVDYGGRSEGIAETRGYRNDDGTLFLDYRSARGLWQFAQGLVEACLVHFGSQQKLADVRDLSEGAGTHVRFVLVGA
jgi:hypothetical protein